jgi:hypothetical protein
LLISKTWAASFPKAFAKATSEGISIKQPLHQLAQSLYQSLMMLTRGGFRDAERV